MSSSSATSVWKAPEASSSTSLPFTLTVAEGSDLPATVALEVPSGTSVNSSPGRVTSRDSGAGAAERLPVAVGPGAVAPPDAAEVATGVTGEGGAVTVGLATGDGLEAGPGDGVATAAATGAAEAAAFVGAAVDLAAGTPPGAGVEVGAVGVDALARVPAALAQPASSTTPTTTTSGVTQRTNLLLPSLSIVAPFSTHYRRDCYNPAMAEPSSVSLGA